MNNLKMLEIIKRRKEINQSNNKIIELNLKKK